MNEKKIEFERSWGGVYLTWHIWEGHPYTVFPTEGFIRMNNQQGTLNHIQDAIDAVHSPGLSSIWYEPKENGRPRI